MSATYGQVRQWSSAGLEAAVTELTTVIDALARASDAVRDADPGTWEGEGGESAEQARARLEQELEATAAEVGAARKAFGDAADAVDGIVAAVKEAEASASTHQFTIAADGTVTDAAGPVVVAEGKADEYHDERVRLCENIVAKVEAVLRAADDVDLDLQTEMNRITGGAITDQGATTVLAAAGAGGDQVERTPVQPPPNPTPAQASAWWDSLTEHDRLALTTADPGLVGGMNGIPAADRDRANRALLATERDRVATELADARQALADFRSRPVVAGRGTGAYLNQLMARVEKAEAKQRSIEQIERVLSLGDSGPSRRSLIELDLTKERAEAAVGIGDVDHADHVSVFTPGLTSTVDGSLAGYDDDQYRALLESRRQLAQAGRSDTVAAVTWIGYQAPQITTESLLGHTSVVSSAAAEEGGRELSGFLRGIVDSRDTDPHLTALGHSYGSTTTGYALQQNTGVDDAVLFGSPGAGTSRVDDLRVGTSGTLYDIEAKNDPVADLGRFGTDPSWMGGVEGLSSAAATAPDGTPLAPVTGHSGYFTDRSTSLYNIAAVQAGLADRAVKGHTRGAGDILSWPVPIPGGP